MQALILWCSSCITKVSFSAVNNLSFTFYETYLADKDLDNNWPFTVCGFILIAVTSSSGINFTKGFRHEFR